MAVIKKSNLKTMKIIITKIEMKKIKIKKSNLRSNLPEYLRSQPDYKSFKEML